MFGTQVNFSDNYNTYYSAYRYVTKEDKDALHSTGHPDLSDAAPRTEQAISCRKGGRKKRRGKGAERLSVYDVCQIVQAKGITSRLQLICLAVQQNREALPEMTDKMAAAAARILGTGHLKMAETLQENVLSSKLN